MRNLSQRKASRPKLRSSHRQNRLRISHNCAPRKAFSPPDKDQGWEGRTVDKKR